MSDYQVRNECAVCDNSSLQEVLNLNEVPLAGYFPTKNQLEENASILNLVEVWKEEEGRKKMIALAEMRKEAIAEEIDNISSMDEIKARVLGLTKEEILES